MKYVCGTEVMLGDEVLVERGPKQKSFARVVAIGLDRASTSVDAGFYEWALKEKIIKATSVVVEWVSENPFEHQNPHQAPVGSYMTLSSLCSEQFVRRGVT